MPLVSGVARGVASGRAAQSRRTCGASSVAARAAVSERSVASAHGAASARSAVSLSARGAALLVCTMVGAVIAHLALLGPSAIPALALGLLSAIVLYAHKNQLRGF